MTATTLFGTFNMVTTGTTPNVVMQLMSANVYGVYTVLYSQYSFQFTPTFTCSFQLSMIGTGDEVYFYAGSTSSLNNKGVKISFYIYAGFAGGAGRSGIAIYFIDSTGTIQASAPYSATGTYQQVSITYTRGTTNTWVVSLGGVTVLTYSDINSAAWLSAGGTYWGIGARDGGATGDFYVSNVNMLVGKIYFSNATLSISITFLLLVF